MSGGVAQLRELVELDADGATKTSLEASLVKFLAVVPGHFALHRGRHAPAALRFRGIGRDRDALGTVVEGLFERMPAGLMAALDGAKILSPESSGFFLGNAIASRNRLPLAISQTDLRRLPTRTLLSGTIEPNDRVVLVNDVAGTGESIDALRKLVAERHAILGGIVLCCVVQPMQFRRYCADLGVPAHWLITAKWASHTPQVDCPGCRENAPLIPIAEIV
jgi:adenine/guanine phosphoribosyltransferase-like PRPP-binding protein